ncbi:hypothetical protein CN154_21860, partial [Sinorhizobium meliloti]
MTFQQSLERRKPYAIGLVVGVCCTHRRVQCGMDYYHDGQRAGGRDTQRGCAHGHLLADSDEAAPLFRDDCAPGFRDDLAPCLVGSAGDDCCQFIQARCQALRGRFRRRLSPLNSMRWA